MNKYVQQISEIIEEALTEREREVKEQLFGALGDMIGKKGGKRSKSYKKASKAIRKGAKPGPKPKAKQQAKPLAKGAKRDPSLIESTTKNLTTYVKKHPGQRIEEIAKGMGVSTKDLKLPMIKLIEAKTLSKKGTKRATTYT